MINDKIYYYIMNYFILVLNRLKIEKNILFFIAYNINIIITNSENIKHLL